MAKPGTTELLKRAVRHLVDLDYFVWPAKIEGSKTRQAYTIEKDGIKKTVLIQCRSKDSFKSLQPKRYVVGLMRWAFEKTDAYVLYFDGEKRMFMIPSEVLKKEFDNCKNTAGFSGDHNQQWRVNIYPCSAGLYSQNSEYDIRLDEYEWNLKSEGVNQSE
jgi:hypothetical protein